MCPRLSLPGHVVVACCQMSRSSTIDDGDKQSIDGSKLGRHHGCQFVFVGSKADRAAFLTDGGTTNLVKCCECSRVATKYGLSPYDFFTVDINPTVMPVSPLYFK